MSQLEKRKTDHALFSEIKALIEQGRQQVAVTVNATMTLLYWQVGKRLNDEVLKDKRAEYGQQVVATLSHQLTAEYGKGWSEKHPRHCLRFAEVFQAEAIVSALRRPLSWTHLRTVMYVDDELKRSFYIEMCKLEKWSTRTLEDRVKSMLYERTVISRKPEETIQRELLQLHKSNIKVADYFTILPSKEVLLDKYHKAIAIARNALTQRDEGKSE